MLAKKNSLKLKIELVPSSAWYQNLRHIIRPCEWDRHRRQVYANTGYKCEICSADCSVPGRMICHEMWEYNDQTNFQCLIGFRAQCRMCDHISHYGLTSILAKKGKVDINAVINHFCHANQCDEKVFNRHLEATKKKWEERSRKKWKLDFGEFTEWVESCRRK